MSAFSSPNDSGLFSLGFYVPIFSLCFSFCVFVSLLKARYEVRTEIYYGIIWQFEMLFSSAFIWKSSLCMNNIDNNCTLSLPLSLSFPASSYLNILWYWSSSKGLHVLLKAVFKFRKSLLEYRAYQMSVFSLTKESVFCQKKFFLVYSRFFSSSCDLNVFCTGGRIRTHFCR